jgi:hypothetical protein
MGAAGNIRNFILGEIAVIHLLPEGGAVLVPVVEGRMCRMTAEQLTGLKLWLTEQGY